MNIFKTANINIKNVITNPRQSQSKLSFAPTPNDSFELSVKPEDTSQKLKQAGFDIKSIDIATKNDISANKLISLGKSISDDTTKSLHFRNSSFDKNKSYLIMSERMKGAESLLLVDKDLNILAKEDTTIIKFTDEEKKNAKPNQNLFYKQTIVNDYRNNTSNTIIYDVDQKYNIPIIKSEIKIKNDKNGNLIRKETTTKSDVSGVYNIQYEFPNGKTKQVSKASVDKKTGYTLIEKDMRSSDMTRTQYRYEDDPVGNRIIDYKITDANGKVLMKQSQSFEKITENKFRSSRNDNVYEIEFNNEAINIKDVKKDESHKIGLKGFVNGDEQKMLKLLKEVPGDELINISNSVFDINQVESNLESSCTPRPSRKGGEYLMLGSLSVSDDLFVLLHETGHAIDGKGRAPSLEEIPAGYSAEGMKKPQYTEKNFVNVYNQERENFLKEFPDFQRSYLYYFIQQDSDDNIPAHGRKETIAESNALLNTYNSIELLGMRSQYLQQHFPKTIAHLSNVLINNSTKTL